MDGAFVGEETKLGLRVQWHDYAAIACDEEWSGVLLQNGVVDMFSLLRFVNFVKIFEFYDFIAKFRISNFWGE